jgi:general secretion pathway protein I
MTRRRHGAALVEMLVAVVLMGVGIAACVACIGSATRASGLAEEYTAVELMAREKLADIETQGAPDGDGQGDFGPDRPGYSWRTNASATEVAGLQQVRLTVLWGNPQNPRHVEFSTYARRKS